MSKVTISQGRLVIESSTLEDSERMQYLAAMFKHMSSRELHDAFFIFCKKKGNKKLVHDVPVTGKEPTEYM